MLNQVLSGVERTGSKPSGPVIAPFQQASETEGLGLSMAAKNGAILAGPAQSAGRFAFGLFLAAVARVRSSRLRANQQPDDVSDPTTSGRVVLVVLPF
jgi:hypothetical protein